MTQAEQQEMDQLRVFASQVRAGKVNEFKKEGSETVYQMYAIPDVGHFNFLGNDWANLRAIPEDWSLDPSMWAGERNHYLEERDAINAAYVVESKDRLHYMQLCTAKDLEIFSLHKKLDALVANPPAVVEQSPQNLEDLIRTVLVFFKNLVNKK